MKLQATVVAALLCLAASLAWSQPMMRTPAERAKLLKERLTLSDDQTKKVEQIFTDAQKIAMEKRESMMGDREAMRAFMTEQAEKTDKLIEKVLDKKQMKKYEEFKKERRERRGPGMRRDTTRRGS